MEARTTRTAAAVIGSLVRFRGAMWSSIVLQQILGCNAKASFTPPPDRIGWANKGQQSLKFCWKRPDTGSSLHFCRVQTAKIWPFDKNFEIWWSSLAHDILSCGGVNRAWAIVPLTLVGTGHFVSFHGSRGWGWHDPCADSPLIELELRGNNERVARHKTKRLVYKFNPITGGLSGGR